MPATTSTPPASMTARVAPPQACDDADVPGDQNPAPDDHQGRHRVARYDAVGDVIHYTITATNTRQRDAARRHRHRPERAQRLDLHAGQRVDRWRPARRSTCTATHTVTQADIDAGNYLNTACVDDGEGGAAQRLRRRRRAGDPEPAPRHHQGRRRSRATTRSATSSTTRSSATNDGNTTLAAVTVTDANATGLVTCTPANGSPLAPGATMTCTATHTVTQADIDAGHYLNTACVDDGDGGADRRPAPTPTCRPARTRT